MANEYSAEVIKFLRQKVNDSFENSITYLGAEQRFVGALRNSSVNNLEEQLLIGTDTVTSLTTDEDGNILMEKSFYVKKEDSSESDYYKLESITYKNTTDETGAFHNGELDLIAEEGNISFGGEDEEQINYTGARASFGETFFNIETSPVDSVTLLREEKLYFITSEGKKLLVLTKTIRRHFEEDGKKEVITESVENHLV